MDKEELIRFIESLKLPKEEFYILSSGCLVLYGIRDVAGDLDICVTPKLGEELKKRFAIPDNAKNDCNFYSVNDKLEFVINKDENLDFDVLNGWQVQKLSTILEFKQRRQKKRDLEDVKNIEEYLKKNALHFESASKNSPKTATEKANLHKNVVFSFKK